MADSKISELTGATSVASVDVLPIVQTGQTKKVTASVLFSNIPVNPVCKEAPETIGNGAVSTTLLTTVIESIVSENISLTLAAGVHGTIKEIFTKTLSPTYSAVVTVTGGKGFSTITFSNVGQSVYLKNINGDWYVISYRGAVIA